MKAIFLIFCWSIAAFSEMLATQIVERCTEQNLGPVEGRVRNKWARRCFPSMERFFNFYEGSDPFYYALVYSPSSNSWKGPVDVNSACGDWQLKNFCMASCYLEDQVLRFADGLSGIRTALEGRPRHLITLDANSDLRNPRFKTNPIKFFSKSWEDGHEVIRVMHTRVGGEIKVTQGHPVLLSNGVMREAKNVRVGDSLVRSGGLADEIVSIDDMPFFGKVYNVTPATGNPIENIVIAQDFLMGSAAYQYAERLFNLMDRKLMREL